MVDPAEPVGAIVEDPDAVILWFEAARFALEVFIEIAGGAAPSAVTNQPLKSTHQTALAAAPRL